MLKIFEHDMVIPTYEVGEEEKNPMFFEKRVYQGSSGKVYPYPVIEKICDDKIDKVYRAVTLENDYVKVVVLPSLGGRVYSAYDKTNGYDFVYKNQVIKPALVGLLGPWISGGIEFNWPQHHRPTTYMAVNYEIVDNSANGVVSVFVGETEIMSGLKHTTEIKLYANSSYIEISTNVFNMEESTKTFLWWANPAYSVNDHTITVMPPDVNAVMDHGKRAVSTFPIATGEYYKMDYSKGVDISMYKNILVPTSFMAYKSEFDFIGGYDYSKNAGLLHVADHLVSPGKKQWTWGAGDFGIAWDRNLTDEDGPYVELMTGCFTDNQPDFTFIEPHECKSFTQYFMPYHNVGRILNADKNICFGCDEKGLIIYSSINVSLEMIATKGNDRISKNITLKPTESVVIPNIDSDYVINIYYNGVVLTHDKDNIKKFDVPSPATACPPPSECKSLEDLYLFGRHIEQYRHATRLAEDYYLEGLKRDSKDIRLNNAYGELLYKRGRVEESIAYFKKACDKSFIKNQNPQDVAPQFNLALAYFYMDKYNEAREMFGKCLWGNKKDKALYYLAVIEKIKGNIENAKRYIKECLFCNANDLVARNFYASMLSEENARAEYNKTLEIDRLNVVAHFELNDFDSLRKVSNDEIRLCASTYLVEKNYKRAIDILSKWKSVNNTSDIMIEYYLKYANNMLGNDYNIDKKSSENRVCFANTLMDKKVLEKLAGVDCDYNILYQLGNYYYDKKSYEKASKLWLECEKMNDKFPQVKRNLALYYFNKCKDKNMAMTYMEKAFYLDTFDSRILMELSQLYDICGVDKKVRYDLLNKYITTTEKRDDLYIDYLSLLVDFDYVEKAYDLLNGRKFHPWEGGEGKVTKLYKRINILLAEKAIKNNDIESAINYYNACFTFPHNLGEGKLCLDYDNDVCYMLGMLYKSINNNDMANKYFELAIRGNNIIADNMYYNDTPVDYVYYAGLAYGELGKNQEKQKIKESFIKYAKENIDKMQVIDYFAVSLPDMLIWEQDINDRNKDFCLSLMKMAENL